MITISIRKLFNEATPRAVIMRSNIDDLTTEVLMHTGEWKKVTGAFALDQMMTHPVEYFPAGQGVAANTTDKFCPVCNGETPSITGSDDFEICMPCGNIR